MLLAFATVWALAIAPAGAQEWTVDPRVEVPDWTPEDHLPAHWVRVGGVHADVHGPASELATLDRLAEHAETSAPAIASTLGLPLAERVQVVVAETEGEFFAIQPGRAPTWADGTAWPTLGVVFLKRPGIRGGAAKPLEVVLDHEIAHVLLGQAFRPVDPPAWLQEGVAQVVAGEAGPETTRELAHGLFVRKPFSLAELVGGFPADPLAARLAYAQSADFILWWMAEYGEQALPRLIRDMARGRSADAAVRKISGTSFVEIDQTWRARFDSGVPLWTGPLGDEIFWMAGALILAIGGSMRRRRFHQRMGELEDEELVLDDLVLALLWRRAGEQPEPIA